MVSKRNRYLDLINYLESCGIEINIGKNKAQGHKGFFKAVGEKYRIDISKNLSENELMGVLAHEFAHFVHYKYNKNLKSLDFIFTEYTEELEEELIRVTVELIDKHNIEPLFNKVQILKTEIKNSEDYLKKHCCTQNLSQISINIEKKLKFSPLKHLLKYDKVRLLVGFQEKTYSTENLSKDIIEEHYIIYKSYQRALKRLNSRISRLNKYYNSPTELFARAFELFIIDENKLYTLAPTIHYIFEDVLKINKIPLLTNFYNEIKNKI